MLSWTFSIVLAPVQTTLPEENINAEVLGSFMRITRPGNCSGLYSVLLSVAAIFSRGISCSRPELTTILTTEIERPSSPRGSAALLFVPFSLLSFPFLFVFFIMPTSIHSSHTILILFHPHPSTLYQQSS